MDLEGKVAVVTGAAGGLGLATAEELARRGARVVIADLNEDGAAAAASAIMRSGGKATSVRVDIADEASVAAMIEFTVAEFGRLDIVHANAALTAPNVMLNDKGIADIDPEVFARVLRVNVIGSALTAKHGAAQLVRNGGGVIIFTTSQESKLGENVRSMYAASKAAIESIMRDTATQFGPQGVRAVSVSPGVVLTEGAREAVPAEQLTRLLRHNLVPRFGKPEDVAATVAFLASEGAGYITGVSIAVDGGMLQHFPTVAEERDAAAAAE